eukprot:TRINITY_DN7541_c0_g1_i2.p1 TRINITY_DN7541_c0_g1~~TRINITY_DN7541_c0_g1_i2.p1  ORF type:complete len:448 (+),score=154.71 TRINITY_DN7541_c0_g1_i2:359-1702(+)
MLDAMEVETGMMVIYDGNCRGWIDNSFQALDEFWVCDEKTHKTVFRYGPDGQEQGVRSFTAKELKFTGLWSPHIEITKEVMVDDEVLYEITKVSTWEADLEKQTEVPIFVDKEEIKVVIGPGPPAWVNEAYDLITQQVDSMRAKLEEAAAAQAPVVKEEVQSQAAEPVQVKEEEAETEDWAQEVERRAMKVLQERQARAKKQAQSAEEDAKAKVDGAKAKVDDAKANVDAEEAFQRGWKAAWQAAMDTQKKADAPAANAEKRADTSEGTDKPKPEGAPEADAAKDAAAKAPAAEKAATASASEDAATKNPEAAAAKAPEDAAAKPPAAPAPEAEAKKDSAKKIIDWVNDQDQFRHLPPLPPYWIRVKKSGSDKIYFVHTRTGEAQFDDPLPEGWKKVKSKSRGTWYYWHEKSGKSQEQIPRVAPSEKPAVSSSTESTQGSGAEKAPL